MIARHKSILAHHSQWPWQCQWRLALAQASFWPARCLETSSVCQTHVYQHEFLRWATWVAPELHLHPCKQIWHAVFIEGPGLLAPNRPSFYNHLLDAKSLTSKYPAEVKSLFRRIVLLSHMLVEEDKRATRTLCRGKAGKSIVSSSRKSLGP